MYSRVSPSMPLSTGLPTRSRLKVRSVKVSTMLWSLADMAKNGENFPSRPFSTDTTSVSFDGLAAGSSVAPSETSSVPPPASVSFAAASGSSVVAAASDEPPPPPHAARPNAIDSAKIALAILFFIASSS